MKNASDGIKHFLQNVEFGIFKLIIGFYIWFTFVTIHTSFIFRKIETSSGGLMDKAWTSTFRRLPEWLKCDIHIIIRLTLLCYRKLIGRRWLEQTESATRTFTIVDTKKLRCIYIQENLRDTFYMFYFCHVFALTNPISWLHNTLSAI